MLLLAGGFAWRFTFSEGGGDAGYEGKGEGAKLSAERGAGNSKVGNTGDPKASTRGKGQASPGLRAIRDAIDAKDAWKLHGNVQKFESGEFLEVWALLLKLPEGGWATQEMELAVSRAANLGMLDEVLDQILKDIPPGSRREPLLKSAFAALKGDLVKLAAKAETFAEPGERKAAYAGIAERISLGKTLKDLDPALLAGGPPELRTALAEGLGRYPVAYLTFTTVEERHAKMVEAVAFAEELTSSGRVGQDFLADMIGTLSSNGVMEVWKYLQESRPGLIESDPRIFRPVLRSLIGQEPQELLALSLQHPWIEAAAMRPATSNWLYRDSAKTQAWFDANATGLTPERQSQVAAGFVDFHLERGNSSAAREWVERVADPKLRDELAADVERGKPGAY